MKTPEQLKGVIRNFAAKNHLRALDVQQAGYFKNGNRTYRGQKRLYEYVERLEGYHAGYA